MFVDNVQIERRHLPMLDLGVINKQPHSFSTTTIVNDAYPPRSSPSPMTTTSHDPERPDTPTTSTPHPKTARTTQQRHVTRHHPQLANERMEHRSTQRHVAVSDVANDEQRHQSLFVVPGEYSLPIPFRSKFARGPGATSPWATWLPNDERRRCRRLSFLVILSR